MNQALSMVFLLLQVKVLTYFLPMSEFGAWSQINMAKILLNIVVCLNLGHGFIRFASSYSPQEKKVCFESVLRFQVILHLLVAALIWPFRYSITDFLCESPSDSIYWALIILSVVSVAIVNVQNYLIVTGRELKMVQQNLIRLVFNVLCTVGAVLIRPDLLGALFGYIVSELLCFTLFSWRNQIVLWRTAYSSQIIKKLLKFSVPLMTMTIAYWVISSSNRYLINYFMGLDAVGQFAVANRLPMMIVVLFTLLSSIFLSNVSRLFDAQNFDRVSYWFSMIFKLFFYLGVVGGSVLIASNRALTLILSNQSYLFDGLPFVYLSVVIGSISFGGFQILSRLYDLDKRVFKNSMNWGFAMLLNVVLNIWLIPRQGLIGAAIATGVSFFIAFLISLFVRPRRIALNVPWVRLTLYALVSFSLAYWFAEIDAERSFKITSVLLFSSIIGLGSLTIGLMFRVLTIAEILSVIRRGK